MSFSMWIVLGLLAGFTARNIVNKNGVESLLRSRGSTRTTKGRAPACPWNRPRTLHNPLMIPGNSVSMSRRRIVCCLNNKFLPEEDRRSTI